MMDRCHVNTWLCLDLDGKIRESEQALSRPGQFKYIEGEETRKAQWSRYYIFFW